MLEIEGLIKDKATQDYFAGHLPRFELQYRLFERYLLQDIKLVYDIGTWFPFASYYFAKRGARVVFGAERIPNDPGIENTMPAQIDLENPLALEPADLVICTECLEHLSCNLYKVRDYLRSLVKEGGYLLLSFPTGGIMFDSYDKKIPKFDGQPHLREFPVPQAREFYHGLGMELIHEEAIKVPLYAHADGILHVLLRKA